MNERPGISPELLRLLIAILAIALVIVVLLIGRWEGLFVVILLTGGAIIDRMIARISRVQRPNVDDLIRRRTEAEIRRLRKEME